MSAAKVTHHADPAVGIAWAVAAYVAWALAPIYFKAVAHVAAVEVLTHRVLWGALLLAALLAWKGRTREPWRAFRDPKARRVLAVSTCLIAFNWLLFIYAVASSRMLEASLGYYLNPLVNVALGVFLLKERLNRAQVSGLILATLGVAWFAIGFGTLPWLSLGLAISFGFYGLLRKRAPVDALTGLAVETWQLLPLAIGYAIWAGATGRGAFPGTPADNILLPLAGVVTIVPLWWFTEGARRIRFTTLGFLQYIAPSGQFLLAVLVYGETFTLSRAITFAFIWAGLAVYTVDLARRAHQRRSAERKSSERVAAIQGQVGAPHEQDELELEPVAPR